MKFCSDCKTYLDNSCFYVNRYFGRLRAKCKICTNAENRKRYHDRQKNSLRYKETRRSWERSNKKKRSRISKSSSTKVREEFLKEYGSKCSCCEERESRFLTIEHSFHDGKEHRKRVGGHKSILFDLRKRNWPKNIGITILCWNCQMATRLGEMCPHALSCIK